jgi:hypothetical protein
MQSLRSLRTLFEELVGEDENYGQDLQTIQDAEPEFVNFLEVQESIPLAYVARA